MVAFLFYQSNKQTFQCNKQTFQLDMAKNFGRDNNFFDKISVSDSSFPADPQTRINIIDQKSLSFVLETNSTVEYSFNGNKTHGDMISGTATSAIFFDNRNASAIWWKVKSGTSPAIIRIEAW